MEILHSKHYITISGQIKNSHNKHKMFLRLQSILFLSFANEASRQKIMLLEVFKEDNPAI